MQRRGLMRIGRVGALLLAVAGWTTAEAGQGGGHDESALYQVWVPDRTIGVASVTVRGRPDGSAVWTHTSRLTAARAGQVGARGLTETALVRDGILARASSTRELAGRALARTVRWDRVGGLLRLEGDGDVEPVPVPPSGVGSLLEAAFRLARTGAAGARERVFDLAEGRLGEVVVIRARDPQGWAETRELGVRVRTHWVPGRRLPDRIVLVDLGMEYRTDGQAVGSDRAVPRPTETGLAARGRLRPGDPVTLGPPDAWAATGCPDHRARLTRAGPACALPDPGPPAPAPVPGPAARSLAARTGKGPPERRAARLARAVAEALDPRIGADSLWEAEPEAALAAGRGDCNEAAAVYAAAAAAAGLTVRRRTGVILDPDGATFWPHAWVEVRLDGAWVRVDPALGEAPARGVYLDLGDGTTLGARLRAASAALRGGWIEGPGRDGGPPGPPTRPRRAR